MTASVCHPDAAAGIVATLNLYAVAVDSRCWQLFDDVFTPDALLDYFGTCWTGLDSFRADFAAAHAGFTSTQHVVGNHVVRADAQGARALSYCQWTLEIAGTPGGERCWGTAWYDDRLILSDAGWRIADRVCGIMTTQGNPAVAGAAALPACAPLHEAARTGRVRFLAG